MPSDHKIRGKYHILDDPLAGIWVDKLLGRIVLDKANPTAITSPPNDGPNGSSIPQNIVPELASDRVPYSTLYYLLNDFKDVDQHAKLTSFFEEKAQKTTSATHTITAIDVERIDISNIPDKLEQLWANEAYRKAAEKVLWHNGQTRKLGIVTGIYVAKSMTVQVEDVKERGVGASVVAPVSEAVGDPTGTLDVTVGAGYQDGSLKTGQFNIDATSIFAVCYTEVGLQPVQKKGTPKKSRFFHLPRSSKKRADDVDYEIYIDTSPGARLFAGSSGSGSSSESEPGSEPGSRTNTNALAVNADSEVRSTTSTRVEEGGPESLPYVFKASETVFGLKS